MIMPFGYGPRINPPLHAARRKVIEAMVEAKGLTPGTLKFGSVVDRHLNKVRYHRESKYDALIPPNVLLLARQGKWPPEKRQRPSPRKRR